MMKVDTSWAHMKFSLDHIHVWLNKWLVVLKFCEIWQKGVGY